MNNQVIFIVDHIQNEECLGYTCDMTKVNHNLERLPKEFLPELEKGLAESHNGISLILTVGRYLILLEMAKDKTSGAMTFFDTQQNDTLAKKVSDTFKSRNLQKMFLEQHERLKSYYDQHFDDVKLSMEISLFN